LYDFAYTDARQAMIEGRADVVMLLGSADNHQLVLEFLHAKDIKLMNFSQAEAYTRLFPDLSHVILPRGVINLSKKIRHRISTFCLRRRIHRAQESASSLFICC